MWYEYKCDACEHITTIQKSIKDDIPKDVKCEECGKKACRVWGNSLIKIPEHMKATSDINDGGYADYDNLKSRFKNAKRPSGKDKVYY